MNIPLSKIKPSPKPVRQSWDKERLAELVESIKKQGVIVPPKVRPTNGNYEIVYGHRRLEAARRAKLKEIECIVEGVDDDEKLIQALTENVVRENMAALDIAAAFQELRRLGKTDSEIAAYAGWHPARVRGYIAMLNAPEKTKKALQESRDSLTESHFRATHPLHSSDEDRAAILKKANTEGLSYRQTERVANSVAAAKTPEQKKHLIETRYSGLLHDPDVVRVQPPRRRKTKAIDWALYPETTHILDHVQRFHDRLKGFKDADEMGKLSPEAGRFLALRIRKLAQDYLEWAEQLEKRHAA